MTDGQTLTSDPCFVHAKLLDGAGGATDITDLAGDHRAGEWLHIDYSAGDARGALASQDIPDAIIDGLTRPDTRPRSLVTEQGVLLVVRCVNTNPGADPEDMVSLRIWLERERMITVRQRRLLAIQDLRDALDAGDGPGSIDELFMWLIERCADRIGDFIDQIEEQIEECEESVNSRSPTELRPQVSRLRRQTAVVRRYLAPMREAFASLDRNSRSLVSEEVNATIHEQGDRMMRFVEDLDLAREKSLVVHEDLNNRIAQDQNARMYVLSLVAAIFLPITFISGVFGMNVAGLPGVDSPDAFLWVMGGMAVISVAILVMFRHRRWF